MITPNVIVLTTGVIFFFGVQYLFSLYYFWQRQKLLAQIGLDIEDEIEKIKTRGQEENGWKNNFPSVTGWESSTLFVASDFILVSPRSKFPFLFQCYLQPFILAKNINDLKERLSYDRVFTPEKVVNQNLNRDLEVTFKVTGAFGQIRMYLTFEDLKEDQVHKVERMKNWCG